MTGPTMDKMNAMFPAPMNYAVVFIATFVLTLVSVLLLLAIKEPEGEVTATASSFGAYAKKFFAIYWKDRPFTTFIFGKWLMSGHIIMLAFLLTYLIQERGFAIEKAGWFTALNGLGLCIGGFTVTKIADVWGPKYLLITAQVIAILYTVLAWLVPSSSVAIIFTAFVISGICQIADNVRVHQFHAFLLPTEDIEPPTARR